MSIKVLLATGVEKLDKCVSDYVKQEHSCDIEIVDTVYYRKGITELKCDYDAVIISEEIPGEQENFISIVYAVRELGKRVIVLAGDEDAPESQELEEKLIPLGVYDYIYNQVTLYKIIDKVLRPSTPAEAKGYKLIMSKEKPEKLAENTQYRKGLSALLNRKISMPLFKKVKRNGEGASSTTALIKIVDTEQLPGMSSFRPVQEAHEDSLKEVFKRIIPQLTFPRKNLGFIDDLTGCYTRSSWEEWLKNRFEENARFCVTMLDLDHFKLINDTYGHQAGDAVLISFGKFLRAQIRNNDIVCRYGGEEFILGFPSVDIAETYKVLERLRHLWLQEKIFYDGILIKVTFSAGIAQYHPGGNVVKEADTALYKAKASGRNRTEIYTAVEHSYGILIKETILRFCTPWSDSATSEVVSLAKMLDSVAIVDANFNNPRLYSYFGFNEADVWNRDWRRIGINGGLETNGKIIWFLDPANNIREDPLHIIETAKQLADYVLIDGGSEPELNLSGFPILCVKNSDQKIIDAWNYFKPFTEGLVLCPAHVDVRGFNLPYVHNINNIAEQLKGV